jgi:hypothetical protein
MTDQMHHDAEPLGVLGARRGDTGESVREDDRRARRVPAAPPTDPHPKRHKLPMRRHISQRAPVLTVTRARRPVTRADGGPNASMTNPFSVVVMPWSVNGAPLGRTSSAIHERFIAPAYAFPRTCTEDEDASEPVYAQVDKRVKK